MAKVAGRIQNEWIISADSAECSTLHWTFSMAQFRLNRVVFHLLKGYGRIVSHSAVYRRLVFRELLRDFDDLSLARHLLQQLITFLVTYRILLDNLLYSGVIITLTLFNHPRPIAFHWILSSTDQIWWENITIQTLFASRKPNFTYKPWSNLDSWVSIF